MASDRAVPSHRPNGSPGLNDFAERAAPTAPTGIAGSRGTPRCHCNGRCPRRRGGSQIRRWGRRCGSCSSGTPRRRRCTRSSPPRGARRFRRRCSGCRRRSSVCRNGRARGSQSRRRRLRCIAETLHTARLHSRAGPRRHKTSKTPTPCRTRGLRRRRSVRCVRRRPGSRGRRQEGTEARRCDRTRRLPGEGRREGHPRQGGPSRGAPRRRWRHGEPRPAPIAPCRPRGPSATQPRRPTCPRPAGAYQSREERAAEPLRRGGSGVLR